MDRLKSSEPSMSKPSRRDKILETLLSTVQFIAMVSTSLADSLEDSLKRRRRQGADDDVGNHQFGSLPLSPMGRRRSINASVEIEVQEESNSPRELELNLPSLQSPTNTSSSSSESTLDVAQALLASAQIKKFTYRELSEATNDFSQVNFLGEGGFGSVYKGVLVAGEVVAVKKLKDGSFQGDREFLNEIEVISRVHHHNLVSLVGYCISGSKRLLVYEYLENNNLATHLVGEKSAVLDWSTRMSIAMGAATGIAYLHEQCCPRIIHRDIKSTNILLDSNYKSKVTDFGLAKLLRHDETRVVTRVIGTCGYLDPEYATTWILTEKSDVFSFGVILLELIIGQHPGNLRDWETLLDQALESGEFSSELVDPKLGRNYDNEEMNRMVACATVSVRPSRDRRPRMSQVLQVLQGNISVEVLKALTSSLDCDPVPSSPHVQQ